MTVVLAGHFVTFKHSVSMWIWNVLSVRVCFALGRVGIEYKKSDEIETQGCAFRNVCSSNASYKLC